MPEIGALRNLRSLDLVRNAITALPESLAQLEHLRELDPSRNPLPERPPVIGWRRGLERLPPDTCKTLKRRPPGAIGRSWKPWIWWETGCANCPRPSSPFNGGGGRNWNGAKPEPADESPAWISAPSPVKP